MTGGMRYSPRHTNGYNFFNFQLKNKFLKKTFLILNFATDTIN